MTSADAREQVFAQVPLGRDYPEIRDAVRAICARYPGAYWRKLGMKTATPRRSSKSSPTRAFSPH